MHCINCTANNHYLVQLLYITVKHKQILTTTEAFKSIGLRSFTERQIKKSSKEDYQRLFLLKKDSYLKKLPCGPVFLIYSPK